MLINIKFKTILKIFFILSFLISLLLALSMHSNTIIMTNENFTKILKECHDNPYKYEGKKIKTSGYIFRIKDFEDTQFVIARDMWINESDSHVVGFLCELSDSSSFKDNDWVSAEGILYTGNYFGPMPILKIEKINKIEKPESQFVLPPKGLNLSL